MTGESLDRTLESWLRDDADRRVPDHLESVLAATVGTRQRRQGAGAWPSWSGRTRVLAIAALVALAAASVTLLSVGRPRPHNVPVPTAVGVNGVLLVRFDRDLYELDANGSNRRAVVVGPGGEFGAVFSPDGSRFAFGRMDDNLSHVQIVVANVDGSRQTVMLETRGDESRGYAWSPDGERLAILHHPGALTDALSIVEVDDPASARDVPLPSGVTFGHFGFGFEVGWASNDELILTASFRKVGQWIYAIRPDGSGFREIVRSPGYEYVGLSADGQWLTYFEYVRDSLGHAVGARSHLVEVATGDDRVLSSGHGAWDQELVISPAGTTGAMVACLDNLDDCDLVIVSLVGSARARVIGPAGVPTPKERHFVFSPDGRKIVLSRFNSPTILIDVATGEQSELGEGMWIEAWQPLPRP